ncbi:MAG TPA: outer membrane beta-barrel protein [Elusimicrobiota bacterium]|jgi:opacity protein-like surface antigen|nr:outer membrane beta-barrel protein [Elusimicrobiota bacterium]
MKNMLRNAAVGLILSALGAGPACAAVAKGDSAVSLGLGAGMPVSDLDLSAIGGGSQSPGEAGLAVDGRYLYQAGQHLAVGGELGRMGFPDRTFVGPRLAGTVHSELVTLQALARYLFLPDKDISPYLIGGLGVNRFSAKVRETFDPGDVRLDSDSHGAVFSAGAGVEAAVAKSAFVGAELRWFLATIDSGDFGTGTLHALNIGARAGYRF